MSGIEKVVAAGGGALDSQIALQSAYWGFDVTIWLRSEGSIDRCQPSSTIESMAEMANQKAEFFHKGTPFMPEKTIIVTNSSSLLPPQFAKDTDRPDRYLALHFANSIWKHNVAEAMVQAQTSDKSFALVMEFARQIHMDPLPVKKEKAVLLKYIGEGKLGMTTGEGFYKYKENSDRIEE